MVNLIFQKIKKEKKLKKEDHNKKNLSDFNKFNYYLNQIQMNLLINVYLYIYINLFSKIKQI